MLKGFTILSAHKYGDILRSTHELRHRSFVERLNYNVPSWAGMEYDKYDNLSTIYISYTDNDGVVRGTCRLAPTDRDYMIKDLWPNIVTEIHLPESPFIWEASRFCVDHTISAEERRHAINSLVCGYQQVGLMYGIEYMIAVMPPGIWRTVFMKSGWDVEFIGPKIRLETNELIVPGKLNVSEAILQNILNVTGLEEPPLEISSDITELLTNAGVPAAFDRHVEEIRAYA